MISFTYHGYGAVRAVMLPHKEALYQVSFMCIDVIVVEYIQVVAGAWCGCPIHQ